MFSKNYLKINFDAVIFHYSFLALRFLGQEFYPIYNQLKANFQALHGEKILIPHDEYVYTRALWTMCKDLHVSRIYCSCFPHDYNKIFPPEEVGGENLCHSVLTGYVDERFLKKILRKQRWRKKERGIDIGYRATRSYFVFGSHGQIKTEVAESFLKELKKFPQLREDIKLTYLDNYSNTITGDAWFSFLMNCRTALGSLGGSSLLDPDGAIREGILAYVKQKSGNVTAEEIETQFYRGADHSIQTFILGPRHFEYAMTHTCELLVEGDYFGILKPGIDYIEIKKDYSNIPEVLLQIQDKSYCEKIANQCYEHLIASGQYTYRKFANNIIDDIRASNSEEPGVSRKVGKLQAHLKLEKHKLIIANVLTQGKTYFSFLCSKAFYFSRTSFFSVVILSKRFFYFPIKLFYCFMDAVHAKFPRLFHSIRYFYYKIRGQTPPEN